MMCMCLGAQARSGYYTDPGGGENYAIVYLAWSTDNESFGWRTGDSENEAMTRFTGFSSDIGWTFTTVHPGMMLNFHYHATQSKDFDYQNTKYKVYAQIADGTQVQIGHNEKGKHRLENYNTAYAVLVSPGFDGFWANFRIFLSQRAIDQGVKKKHHCRQPLLSSTQLLGALMQQHEGCDSQSISIDLSSPASGIDLVKAITTSGHRHIERVILSPIDRN